MTKQRFRRGDRPHGAFVYARYSTENQNAKTIEEQVSDCSAYCHTRALPVLGIYPDYAVSGMARSRPQLDLMLDDFRAGLADTLVIYDQSRLSRDMLNWFSVRAELDRLGVQLLSITQEYVGGSLRDSSVLIQETIIGLHNQMHVADTSRKVKAALRYRAQMGQHTGGVPALGYRVEDKRLVIDDTEAAVVRRIFAEYDSGRSYKSIIDGLNADGIRTKRGSAFGTNSLHDLLKNRKYIGEVTFGALAYRTDGTRDSHRPEGKDPVTIQNDDLAIIDRGQFERVQQRMAINKHAQGGRPPKCRDYPLKGKVFCGECGSAMTVARSVSKGTAYYYYRCSKKDRTHDCSCPPIRADRLEEIAVTYVSSILGNTDVQAKIIAAIRQETDRILQGGVAKFDAAKSDLDKVSAQIDRIVDAIASGAYSTALNDRLKALEGRKAELQQSLQAMRVAAEVARLPEERMQQLFATITNRYSTAAILSVISKVEVTADAITIYTAFDPDPDPKRIKIDRTGDDVVIVTDGIPSGVPTEQIPDRVSAFLVPSPQPHKLVFAALPL